MYYYLMRKNDVVTTVELNDMGQLVWADYQNVKEPEKLPLELATSTNRLSMWWEHRSVPIKQGKIAEMLREKRVSMFRGVSDKKSWFKSYGLLLGETN